VPAAHYSCGGVFTDKDAKTTIENLYACGEVACTGVHGANRLASNSLLEAVVFAHRASVDAAIRIHAPCGTEIIPMKKYGKDENIPYGRIEKLTYELREMMWKWVGIVRSNKRLERALSFILDMKIKTDDLFRTYKPVPELLELRNMVLVSELIVRSAMWRKESRGLHYNIDYPSTEDSWKKDTILKKSNDNTAQILN
ncbi:MAG: FAD-binding protein, partial [Armatimonadota bacterium]